MRCSTEAARPSLSWAAWRWSTAYKTFYLYNMPHTCPRSSLQATITYSYLLTYFDMDSGSSVDHASGGVGGVLVSPTTIVSVAVAHS